MNASILQILSDLLLEIVQLSTVEYLKLIYEYLIGEITDNTAYLSGDKKEAFRKLSNTTGSKVLHPYNLLYLA
ncbi:2410_t:CDS:2 [Funneliformis geosporum]|uniref:2410_t:CDS:1 n=1 Tax=Funneliformis geosporum TaxID=1117311 RepID=A0A9W4WTZ9_9GLOM|nr:2410_t:CDS:2 [Funneliformis geosporum]